MQEAPPGDPPDVATDVREAELAAVRLLGRREHGRTELARKLVGKGHPPEVVRAVIEQLAERELVSDMRFVETFARTRIDRGHGPLKIRAELRERGIDDSLVDDVLTETGEFWREQAERARDKRFGADVPTSRANWTRQARFLSQRGFPSDVIYRVLGSE